MNNNNLENKIKEELNKYMDEIQVPKNLGGIIMKDYENIKNEEVNQSNQTNDQKNNKTQKSSGYKTLKISVAAVSAVVLIGAGVLVGSKFFGNQNITINGNGGQNSGMVSSNQENSASNTTGYTDIKDFWTEFRTSVLSSNYSNIKKITQFPLKIYSSEEIQQTAREVSEQEFDKEFSALLKKNIGFGTEETVYDWIKAHTMPEMKGGADYDNAGNYKELVRLEEKIAIFQFMDVEKDSSGYWKITNIADGKYDENVSKVTYSYEYEAVNDNYKYIIKSNKDIKEMEEVVLEITEKNNSKTYTSKVCKISSEGAAGTTYMTFEFELDNGTKGKAIIKYSNVADNKPSLSIEKISGSENIATDYKELNCIKGNSTINTKEGIVSDRYSYEATIGNETVTFKIPKINIDSEYSKQINKEIEDGILKRAIEQEKMIKEEKTIAGLYKIEYSYSINNNIVSILLGHLYEGGLWEYTTYNIDKNTGDRVKNSEILKYKNITEDTLTKKTQNAAENKFIEINGGLVYRKFEYVYEAGNTEQDFKEYENMYKSQLEKTRKDINCNMDNDLYLNEQGELISVVRIYAIAGSSEGSDFTFNIDKIKEDEMVSAEEIFKIEEVLHDNQQYAFALTNYTSPEDLIKNYNKETKRDGAPLKYSIAYSVDVTRPTESQWQILKKKDPYASETGSTYLITEESLIHYLYERLHTNFSSSQVRNAFGAYYNDELDTYVLQFSDSAFLNLRVKTAKKKGNIYELELNYGAKVVLEKGATDITYYFKSCQGFDRNNDSY